MDWIKCFWAGTALALIYLLRVNHLLNAVPHDVRKLYGQPWTAETLKKTYNELETHPIDYRDKLPPRLERRYIVTGGNGLVGGYIVLQLLARGTPATCIRILDIRKPERNDMLTGPATEVDFIQTNISSKSAVEAAFNKPWDTSVAHLPLTVFHTAAVILAAERLDHLYEFPEAVNVTGTKNVLEAAVQAGADIFSSTSSGSICVRPVEPFVLFDKEPRNFAQIMNETDFRLPVRPRHEFFGNYPRSKAVAERIVCDANTRSFRTGCIRPANGVYGNPSDNLLGGPLCSTITPTFIRHIVQSFVHGANVAIAHLQHEAVLARGMAQAGRPFVVTDPNPPISYSDLYLAISALSTVSFHTIPVPPVLVLLISYLVEWYQILLHLLPSTMQKVVPPVPPSLRPVQPGIISICAHLIASDQEARNPVGEGGLGYQGVLTTMQGVALEILEWNRENVGETKLYTTSLSFAEQLRQMGERE